MIEHSNQVVLAAIEALLTSIDNSNANGTLTRTVINDDWEIAETIELVGAGSASLYVVACFIMANAETNITLLSAATPLTGIMPISSRSGFILPPWPGVTGGWLKTASAEALNLKSSAAADIDGFIITRDLV